ncbi:D-alanine--D-alanine ligase family protein [Clostridium estertheticum]|uniref:D-alanine--D-alanine ligase n=2 Tax=Clostridium estertheticum TaxID=238834 RepID=A0A1J0GCQ1_9CLOT|nr:D-alanine--D-alanine ligase family protein [Clostridium estertheticum]APC38760.1 D-alanine--D-alanine ligase A [Clostridium estertheticum subsp. estertheticum]MBU3074629.1 D-alanine--D-alanine ligase [Clostridium estertheticum]MBU3164659.1 D-alanine--D-alanine ligase [Clostridium estertheticum]MBU3171429.1 D-alanine--D-alanine ligase [Clostridium estertheticum]MBZ9615381.1 D-alanine--D-alanine ligase [Clostridium estertheticum subsp. laramiense]
MKKKVAILFGGQSTEHEVSRASATSVLKNIDQTKYDIYPIGITKDGLWFQYTGKVENIENGEWETDEYFKMPEGQKVLFNKEVDVVFPVLHGSFGEDGTIQGMCKLYNIPCVGPGVMSSAICMDKIYTKYLLEKFNVKQADYVVINASEYVKDKDNLIASIEKKLGYPVFIKPANGGSSVGITKAHDQKELIVGVIDALKYDRKILVEQAINAKEIEVGVLGNDDPKATIPGEVIPAKEFYDYEAKYNNAESKLLIPAALNESKLQSIKDEAIKIYKILDCAGMARVDFLVDKETEDIYLNEVNTIPGFTKISMYPKMWQATGKTYVELIDELIELAIERNNK